MYVSFTAAVLPGNMKPHKRSRFDLNLIQNIV